MACDIRGRTGRRRVRHDLSDTLLSSRRRVVSRGRTDRGIVTILYTVNAVSTGRGFDSRCVIRRNKRPVAFAGPRNATRRWERDVCVI